MNQPQQPMQGVPQQIQQPPQQYQQPPAQLPIPGVTVVTDNGDLIPQFLVVSREKEGKSATVGTTLVNYPNPGMHPLFFAFDENGPNSCLKLGYQPHVMNVKKMQGTRWIEKTRDGLTRLEANLVQVRAQYGAIVVDCASTMVDNFHEDARRDPQNPDGRSHFGAALLHSKETQHRLTRLGLPIWWLAWLREPETVEEKIGNDAKTVKVKRLVPGGANILGSFKAILPGKAQHIFILEKKNVGPHPYADETGHVRVFHTRDHANIRAGGRFSHLLPPEVPAHCGQIMRIIMGGAR
jgi:hypothetical protein